MIPLDKETFEAYMERLLEQVEKVVGALDKKDKKPQNFLNGERLYNNQDVCLLLNISKRTLQRYRDNGLKYNTICIRRIIGRRTCMSLYGGISTGRM